MNPHVRPVLCPVCTSMCPTVLLLEAWQNENFLHGTEEFVDVGLFLSDHIASRVPLPTMDVSSYSLNLSSLSRTVWNFYVQYLWNWTDYPNSWVSRIAYTARVLAILLVLPIVILMLLVCRCKEPFDSPANVFPGHCILRDCAHLGRN